MMKPSNDEALKQLKSSSNALTINHDYAVEILQENSDLRAKLESLPADWSKDSSLETWFPLKAEEISKLRARLARQGPESEWKPRAIEAENTLVRIGDIFAIGQHARTPAAIMANVENALHFSQLLHAVEREFFMVPGEPDDEFPDEEPGEECLVNCWGSSTWQYVEQFRAALKQIAPAMLAKQETEIIKPVLTELYRAMRKFPTWPTDPVHASKIIDEEVGELSKAILQATYEPQKSGPDEVREEAIQVAAMAIRFIISLDKYEYMPAIGHEQPELTNGDKGAI